MLKKLLIVFASGTILCIVALSLAWVTGGKNLPRTFFDDDAYSFGIGGDHDGKVTKKSRDFAVDSSQPLTMTIPVNLHFTRGEEARMTVRGPAEAIDRLVWENSRLSIKPGRSVRRGLEVTIVAPQLVELDLSAPANVGLAGLQQDQFRLKSSGAVNLKASGNVRQLFITTEGAGHLDLKKVDAESAVVRLDGVGNVSVAPSRLADVVINGVGRVSLHRKPEQLRSEINGVGSIGHNY